MNTSENGTKAKQNLNPCDLTDAEPQRSIPSTDIHLTKCPRCNGKRNVNCDICLGLGYAIEHSGPAEILSLQKLIKGKYSRIIGRGRYPLGNKIKIRARRKKIDRHNRNLAEGRVQAVY